MRFISGNRSDKGGGRKSGIAGVLYKLNLENKGKKPPEPTPEEKYQKMFNEKMDKMMSDLAKGKKTFVLPGTKQDKPKEKSKSFQATMEMLARKKAQAALKKEKKKQNELERKKYFAKVALKKKAEMELFQKETLVKQQTEYQLQQQQEYDRQQQLNNSPGGSYFFGSSSDEKKDSWW